MLLALRYKTQIQAPFVKFGNKKIKLAINNEI